MGPLQQIYNRLKPNHHDTGDRGTLHSYVPFYEVLMAPWRTAPMQLLEVGVFYGHGVVMWAEYFEKGTIYGVDIKDRLAFPKPDNLRLALDVDATVERDFAPVLDNGPFDFIIDDGSHRLRDQIRTLELAWPTLRAGGYYIIEDVGEPDALRYMLRDHPGFLTLLDFRQVKGRWDDILAILYKEA